MSTINEDLAAVMETATSAAEIWLGQKAKRMILVTEQGQPIHYQFGIGFELAPGDTDLTAILITTSIDTAMKVVGEFITANCHVHFVRATPETRYETSFDTKVKEWRGYMRGTMIGAAIGAGPAKSSKYDETRVPGFASL